MIQINLLPWREQARKKKQARFGVIALIAAGLGLFFSVLFYMHFSSRISHQLKRVTILQTALEAETASLMTLNKQKAELLEVDNQLHFIYKLRQSSYKAVNLLNELVTANPDSVTLFKIIRTGSTIVVFGKAKSNMQITLFMESIEKSKFFDQPVLTEISGKEKDGGEVRIFQLKLEQQD